LNVSDITEMRLTAIPASDPHEVGENPQSL
jgi:hypothetical protein